MNPDFINESKIRSPLRFPGSKYQAYKFIEPILSSIEYEEYREPFFGGGAIFFAKPKSKVNWINDLSKELMITFQVIADFELKDLLIERLSKEDTPTKERHLMFKNKTPKEKFDIAYRYYYLNRTSYSGIMKKPAWGFHLTKSVHPHKLGGRINESHVKLQNVKMTNIDYEDVINSPANGNSVLLFVDPPYYNADQKRAYEHSFIEEDHTRVAKVLKKTKHKFILTYDDCAEIKDLYSWANVYPVSWRYHTANSNTSKRRMGAELIITNFKLSLEITKKFILPNK